jgi:peptidyl-prolyl cis-trans isomerase D
MLQVIRDRAQGFFAWLIVGMITVPFALWGVNEYFQPSHNQAVAEVNGIELSQNEFQNNVQTQKRNLRSRFQNMDMTPMEAQIKQNVLNQMIDEELLVQTTVQQGLRISDALLAARIREFPSFQQEGQFSPAIYQQALQGQGLTPTGFEAQIRRVLLTDQLREGVSRSVFVTDAEQQQAQRLEEQQRLISYLLVPSSRFSDKVTVSDAEIEKHYQEHTAQYMISEKVSVDYVELEGNKLAASKPVDEALLKQRYEERKASYTTPAQWHARHILLDVPKDAKPEVSDAALKQAKEVLAKIRGGADFEATAKEFSKDSSNAKNGGDLGWFGAGQMVKPFEDAVKAMKAKDISEPVKTEFGYHLIQLVEDKPTIVRSFDEVRAELLTAVQKEQAETEFYAQVEQFGNLAFENQNSLDTLLKTMKLEKKSTGLFDRKGIEKDPILSVPKVLEVAFSDSVLKEGYNSEVVELGTQHVIVFRLKDHEAAKPKALVDVKEEIRKAIKQEKAQTEAKNLGKQLLEAVQKAGDADAVAKQHNLKWADSQWIKRRDPAFKQVELAQAAFKTGRPEANSALYEGVNVGAEGDYAILAVLGVKEPAKDDKKADPQNRAKLQQQMAIGDNESKQMLANLKAQAQIKTFADRL